ncbi:MAG: putative toxin-antitoxin system toxin component, PIN family [Anaerolineae bacterium]|nr:putative toxin-antitoxin system toxin component, PIN family [Anaerolineae bacterium]
MTSEKMLRAVIDTNVLFEGLTQQHSLAGSIIDAWLVDLFQPYTTNALVSEYADVLSRKLSPQRWHQLQPLLGTLLTKTQFVEIHYTWRPISPDPADDHIIDCAMNANAIIVTANLRDFRRAKDMLGVTIMSPFEFVVELAKIE